MVQRLSNGTQAASLPAPAAATGTPGFATDGNPATATPASVIDNDQWNQFQEELVTLATATGQTPSKTDNTQVYRGVSIVGTRVAIFIANGTFTVPVMAGLVAGALVRSKVIICGGGGGGMAGTTTQAGSGGAAGGFGWAYFDLIAGSAYTVNVGAAGAGGTPGGQGDATTGLFGGYNGGVTSFVAPDGTVLFTANGGSAGVGSSSIAGGGIGGSAPTATGYVANTLFAMGGGDGEDGSPGSTAKGGGGAPGPWGGNGRAGVNNPGDTLGHAFGYGAGGGATYGANPGNAASGGSGICIIEY